ncbi:UNVERIFIED_CONTAM: hypothetical protein Scaly_3131500 [Sesamum calycinum]|uniref:DUF8018 domain-containing protein n=1 Tax=Sesamum calycinum TaxID=2727403 RepID=A0AAW2JHW5_9LAMI
MVGGDSVRTIQSRLLSNNPEPSFEEIQRAHIDAQDRFEVKVEILRQMATLDPDGDWESEGLALDNPHTSTGKRYSFSYARQVSSHGISSRAPGRVLSLFSPNPSNPDHQFMGSWHEDARVFLCIGAWFQDSWSAQFIDLRQQDCYFLLSEVKAKASWSLPSSVESDFPFDSGLDWLRAIHRSIGTRASKSFLWANGESSRSGLKSNSSIASASVRVREALKPCLLQCLCLSGLIRGRSGSPGSLLIKFPISSTGWVGYSLIWAYKRAWGLEVGEGVRLGEYPDFSFSAVFDFGAGVSVTRLLLSIPSTESKKKKSYTCTMGLDRYACRILPNPLTSSLASQAVNFIEPSSLLSMLPLSFPPGSSLQQMRSHMRKRTVLVIGSYPDLEFSLPSRVKGMRSQGEREEKRLVESLFANILIWKSSFCGKDPPHSTTSQRSSYWLRKQSIVKFSQVNYFSALAVQSPY